MFIAMLKATTAAGTCKLPLIFPNASQEIMKIMQDMLAMIKRRGSDIARQDLP
jgi:hypothetical protein